MQTQFQVRGYGVFPTPVQTLTVDTGGAPFYEFFSDEQDYKQTLRFALQELRPSNRRQVLFVIPGSKK
jgi:hypothetical protein